MKFYFFDDDYVVGPVKKFTDPDTGYTISIESPQVVVTINAGPGRYTLPFLKNNSKIIRSSSYAWIAR